MSKPQDQLVNSGIQVVNSISSILPFLKTYFCISICFIIPNKIDILGGGVFHLYNVSMTYKVYLDGLFYIKDFCLCYVLFTSFCNCLWLAW